MRTHVPRVDVHDGHTFCDVCGSDLTDPEDRSGECRGYLAMQPNELDAVEQDVKRRCL
jgi:hypothetical protein